MPSSVWGGGGTTPSTTSFLVTFPNQLAAETAQTLAETHLASFLSIKGESNHRNYRTHRVAISRRRQLVPPGKEHIEPTTWYSRSLMRSYLQENVFPRVDTTTGKPVPVAEMQKSTRLRYMTPDERLEAASDYVKAFREARIGPFGNDDKARVRGDKPMSGRQVVMWGMPDAIREQTWSRVLKGYKLAEEDAIFHVPKTIQGRRSTYIITLQTTSEAHRLARHLNMMDFRSDKDMAMHLLRAQVLW